MASDSLFFTSPITLTTRPASESDLPVTRDVCIIQQQRGTFFILRGKRSITVVFTDEGEKTQVIDIPVAEGFNEQHDDRSLATVLNRIIRDNGSSATLCISLISETLERMNGAMSSQTKPAYVSG